ncbi:Flp family type IVb pilin [Vibrio campbellii]
MEKFTQAVKDFWNDEEGLTVVEYVVGAGLLVVGLSGLFTTLGTNLEAKLKTIVTNIEDNS